MSFVRYVSPCQQRKTKKSETKNTSWCANYQYRIHGIWYIQPYISLSFNGTWIRYWICHGPMGSEPKKQVVSQLGRNCLESLHVGDVCHLPPIIFPSSKKRGVLSMAKNTWETREISLIRGISILLTWICFSADFFRSGIPWDSSPLNDHHLRRICLAYVWHSLSQPQTSKSEIFQALK